MLALRAADAYRLWSASYDRDPNPILALERRVLRDRLGPLSGRCLLDIGTAARGLAGAFPVAGRARLRNRSFSGDAFRGRKRKTACGRDSSAPI